MRIFDLSSKENYLKWVQEWKHEYKSLSAKIRDLKNTLSIPHVVTEHKNFGFTLYESNMSVTQSQREHLKILARDLLQLRYEGKISSWELKQQLQNTI